MKKLLFPLFLASATFASNASALDLGLGVTLFEDPATSLVRNVANGVGSTIYVPMELNESMRLEPFISRLDGEQGLTEYSYTRLGAGFFGKAKTGDATQLYFGGRVAYVMAEAETGATKNYDMDGIMLAPTAGLEYYFNKKFSIAGEVILHYTDLDNRGADFSEMGTASNIMLRWYY